MTPEELIRKDRRERGSVDLFDHPREWRVLGVVEYPQGGSIVVEVCEMPARFYRMTISSVEEKPITLTTGSGRLEHFLPAAQLFALDMLGIEGVPATLER